MAEDRTDLFGDPGTPEIDGLLTTLAERADELGLVDVAVGVHDSPLGRLLLAATPLGLVRLAFAGEDEQVVRAELAARVSPRLFSRQARFDAVRRALDAYFADGSEIAVPLDLRLAHGFRREVVTLLPSIRAGRTMSYAALAAAAGRPRAIRAAASACASNPLPLVLPCHRVVRSDGSVGEYRGGTAAKRWLLAHEGAIAG